jgi:Uma2 family endonuclease
MLTSIDEKPYTEILDGRAVQKVSPKRKHSLLQWRIAALLQQQLAGDRGDVGTEWRFYMDPPGGLQTSLVPDVAYVSHERLEALTSERREKPPFSPDIAFELRSPGDRVNDVEWKMHAYVSMGGTIAFDVLLDTFEVRAFTLDHMQTYKLGDRVTCEALPWLTFTVDELFAGIRD